ncbi:Myb/SANT-like DNA-binding domain-containing protein [Xylariaceae sp. FL0594]|nr:Myb/SANT-like DNA-binding domain-containing protein [Xylariaceae sp. FL0594]
MENNGAQIPPTNFQTPTRRGPDQRTPRFSWSSAYEETFFRSLCESMQMGYKDNHNFKSGAWERAAVALRDKHNAYPEKSHLINKADNARKRFRTWRSLREDPDFVYNPATRMVTASEEAWKRHFESEPTSKALRGRPFEHEEYMEILFPDVIGTGGAPKRIMKPRRQNPDRTRTADTSTVGPNIDPSSQDPTRTQQLQTTPSTSEPTPRPTATTTSTFTVVPHASTAVNAPSALTPPEDATPSSDARKRPNPDGTPRGTGKRRGRPSRFAPHFWSQPSAPVSSTPSLPAAASSTAHSSNPATAPLVSSAVVESSVLAIAEALKARFPPKWSEQAVEIFFRDFTGEDADLQLKIAEKALTDENKAMVFVKMPPVLRRHWVSRLREVHMRNLGGGGLGLGRVGEEAS